MRKQTILCFKIKFKYQIKYNILWRDLKIIPSSILDIIPNTVSVLNLKVNILDVDIF